MADINFDCPFCDQNIDAPEQAQGRRVHCPGCGQVIRVPEPAGPRVPIKIRNEKKAPPGSGINVGAPAPRPDEDKSTTTKIELPPVEDLPPQPPTGRTIFIKRPGH